MHLADGVLSAPVVVVTSVGAVAMLAYSMRKVKEEEIPRISLMTGAFFALSLVSIPVGPSSVHPLLGGLLGIVLGRRAVLAFFVGLLLQAILFHHGGLTTLGVNTLMLALPALLAHKIFYTLKNNSVFLRGSLAGATAVIGTAILLATTLFFSDQRFAAGFFSVINLLLVSHFVLAFAEGLITGFAIKLLYNARPHLLESKWRTN